MNLRLVTWNIAYCHGAGSDGTHYEQKNLAWHQNGLREIANALSDANADVVCLQEVDFDSARSHHFDQAQVIAELAHYPHIQKLELWNRAYVPFPGGLNLTKHWGRIQSGLAILSKFPITPAKNIVFPKPKKNSAAYNYFYINRGVQICSLTLPGIHQPIQLANLHLEAFDPLSRGEQLVAIEQECEKGTIDWAVGDWNGIERPTPSLYQSSPCIPTFPAQDPKDFFDGGVFAQRTGILMKTSALPPIPYSDHRAVYFDLTS